jgi:DNA-binding transcriptional regulator YiaG
MTARSSTSERNAIMGKSEVVPLPVEARRVDPATLTAWRKRMGFSQREASIAIECSRTAWANWESGRHRIPRYIGLAIAALALGLSAYGGKEMAS